MELSRIAVAAPFAGAETLYHRGGREENGTLLLRAGETADLRTYFGSLDTQLLLEKTTVRYLTLRLFFAGKATVTLYRTIPTEKKAKKCRRQYTEYIVAQTECDGEARFEADVFGGGLLGVTVTASDDVTVYGGVWECSDRCARLAPRIGIICLGCTPPDLDDPRMHIYSIGGGADTDNADNTDTAAIADTGVTALLSSGYGECGDAVRGILECVRKGDTHFLLLRGEVDPNCIRRAAAIISVLSVGFENCGIGGARMDKSDPCTVASNGYRFGKAGEAAARCGAATDLGGMLWSREGGEYGGWHFLCAPVRSAVAALPMPLYAGGAAEFGMRSEGETLFTVGICAWAEESEIGDYYNARNGGIVRGAVLTKKGGGKNRRSLLAAYFKCAIRRRDKLVDILDGYNDYLKGPKALLESGGNRVTVTKKRGFFGVTGRFIKLWFRLFRSKRVNAEYAAAFSDLTSASSWVERLTGESE